MGYSLRGCNESDTTKAALHARRSYPTNLKLGAEGLGRCPRLQHELSFRNCLHIFEVNSLSVSSFAIIFSHSEGCLFTLLIVSSVVQKLLI